MLHAVLMKFLKKLWLGFVSCLAVCNQGSLKIQIFNQKERTLQKRDIK